MYSARHVPMLLLLVAGVVLVAGASQGGLAVADRNRKADFDYFYLVRQWPATFCNDHYCTHRPPKKYAFTVHGLWPQRRDGTWPEFCDSSSELKVDDIWDLLPDLERVWPSWSSDDETFWNHEWTRHGTCAESVIGYQHEFFKTVLDLHNKLNIQEALQARDIVPSNYAKYHVEALMHAIDDMYGVMPHITCDGEGQLAEVWMCINKKLKPIDCVEGPHPHHASSVHSATPSNFNCNLVTIPKLGAQSNDAQRPRYNTSASQKGHATEVVTSEEQGEQPGKGAPAGAARPVALGQQLPLFIIVAVLVVAALAVAAGVVVQLVLGNARRRSETIVSAPTRSGHATASTPLLHAHNGEVGV